MPIKNKSKTSMVLRVPVNLENDTREIQEHFADPNLAPTKRRIYAAGIMLFKRDPELFTELFRNSYSRSKAS